MIYAVIGGRSFGDYPLLFLTLEKHYITEIVSGEAIGADSLAKKYALEKGIKYTPKEPDWVKYPKTAGFVRNKEIIRSCDICVAFWDGVSSGTLDSLKHAKRLKKKTFIVSFGDLTSEELHGIYNSWA